MSGEWFCKTSKPSRVVRHVSVQMKGCWAPTFYPFYLPSFFCFSLMIIFEVNRILIKFLWKWRLDLVLLLTFKVLAFIQVFWVLYHHLSVYFYVSLGLSVCVKGFAITKKIQQFVPNLNNLWKLCGCSIIRSFRKQEHNDDSIRSLNNQYCQAQFYRVFVCDCRWIINLFIYFYIVHLNRKITHLQWRPLFFNS